MPAEHKEVRGDCEVDRLERYYFVGRERELRYWEQRLSGASADRGIINVYGTGGIGKSFLLDEYRRVAESLQAVFVYADFRLCAGSPTEFCRYMRQLLPPFAQEAARAGDEDAAALADAVLRGLHAAAERRRLVLAFDTFEEAGELEHWLREKLLSRLHPDVVTVIAGRFPLQGPWLASPAWRGLLLRMPLADLDYDDVKQYLHRSGISDEERIATIWARTKGHPLTLSLLASTALVQSTAPSAPAGDDGVFDYVVKVWLKEAAPHDIRELVEAAAVLRHFNQELLQYVSGLTVPAESFRLLTAYSFVRRTGSGWMLHDMLRDAIAYELRLRAPDHYDCLWQRCAKYYYLQLSKSAPGRSVEWARADWVYYIADRMIRTLFYQKLASFTLEPLHPANWAEAERYIARRFQTARDAVIMQQDPDTGERYEYAITAEQSLSTYRHFDLKQRHEMDERSVKLIRGSNNEVCGMASIMPIHERTLGLMRGEPPFGAYFAGLSEAEWKELNASADAIAGYFIEMIDVFDYSDSYLRQAAGMTFIQHMLSFGLVVTTAPSIPFFQNVFGSLGLARVAGIEHFDYGDAMATSYYVLDTRGKKLNSYLDHIASTLGLEPHPAEPDEALRLLSVRERGVFRQLLDGRSNMEIAVELCLSEATVKKHVSNIFKKLHVKTRVQLMNRYFNTTFG